MYHQRSLTKPRWDKIKGTHERGTRIEGRVRENRTEGYIIQTGRGRHLVFGFLSKTNLLQEQLNNDSLKPEYQEGDLISAFVQDYDDERMQLVLSCQEIDHTAIKHFLESVAIGDELIGRVVDHSSAGVFVRLDNGFDALLPKQEVPGLEDCAINDVLRLGDQVIGTVFHKNIRSRHVHLSITKYLSDWKPTNVSEPSIQEPADQSVSSAAEYAYNLIPKAKYSRRVAVLDDDPDNLIGLGSFLLGCGHHVHTSDTLEKFFDDLEQYDIQCVVIDLFVHGENVLSTILNTLNLEYPDVKVIVCSAFYEPTLTKELHGTHGRIIDAILKPVDLDRLAKCVESMKLADHFEIEDFADGDSNHEKAKFSPQQKTPTAKHRKQALEDAFNAVCRSWPKDAVLIVHCPRHSRDPEFVLSNNIESAIFNKDRLQLKFTPIGNVINNAEAVKTDELDSNPHGRGYDIRRMVTCSSMIGMPILVMDEPEYGLFVFRSTNDPFTSDDLETLGKIARESHLSLERITNMEVITRDHTRLAMANLVAGVAHETGNAINAMVLNLKNMENCLPQLEKGTLCTKEQKILASLLKSIIERGPAISNILKGFLCGMSERSDASDELYKLLYEVIEAVGPQAKLDKIKIHSSVDPKLATIKYPNLPIRQSIFNLVLNAIQHLLTGESREKQVSISAGISDKETLPVWISIVDTGRGIHEDLREKVFNAFYTTRKEGSGLGLYLTKWFIESLGGRIFIHDTVRFKGTEFRIELPNPNENQ